MMKWLRSVIAWIKNLFAKKTMRRKISLYIGDQLADLDDQSFILFNYQMDDLSNPTIVKNSFSQQITLKGTPANNRIFGNYFRVDRRVANTGGQTGVDFNASQKVPFTIYNEMGEILESGYIKLDSISKEREDIQYKVTLYGGLGSFFYALSYDENGNKRTLADLDYLQTGSSESELNFIINAESVQEAWRRLQQDTTAAAMWDVINFAPAYNGIPEGNFAPDKAIMIPSAVNLLDSISQEESGAVVTYTTKGGYALLNLANAQDEWSIKDLRSYLQRPVFSMKAFWTAICNPANNGGFEVDADDVLDDYWPYAHLWMTLPMISSISAMQEVYWGVISLSPFTTSGSVIGRYMYGSQIPSGTKVTANVSFRVRFNMPQAADQYTSLPLHATTMDGRNRLEEFSAIFIQVVAYGSDGVVVGGSKIKYGGVVGWNMSGKNLAEACNFTPAWGAEYEQVNISEIRKVSDGIYEIPSDLFFFVEASGASYLEIRVNVFPGTSRYNEGGVHGRQFSFTGTGNVSTPAAFVNFSNQITPLSTFPVEGSAADTVSFTASRSMRSGALITKSLLLSSPHTPAEYMLSFCKMFGLYFTYDNATRKVTILRRNHVYQDETIDLTRRVDLSKGISIQPLVFNAKWYDFMLDGVGGAFYDEYLNEQGVPYGIQRVNTGYDFNADAVNLMESVVFKNACTILAKSKYFNYIYSADRSMLYPSQFLDKGNTYTLWEPSGKTLETDISCPPLASDVVYYNDRFHGFDINEARKLDLRTKDNKPLDGAGVLVFHEGFNQYDNFHLTDDTSIMELLNDGVPCWIIGALDPTPLNVPIFQRYVYGNVQLIEGSLDFGVPRQFEMPSVRQSEGCTIYDRGWRRYMVDRYDVNTKVMTCRVNFAGMQVNQGLLRKFYWYDNSLWVLNKIKNYSLTTFDPVECEFVQVQDKDNYLNGQSY